MKRCHGCGIEKNPEIEEIYPYPEDGITHEPVSPFFNLEVEPTIPGQWKIVNVCHQCFHKLDPDMWINERIWESIQPTTPFSKL
jgi:hypothetical protein